MHTAEKMAVVDETLHRVAEEVGDITGSVMSLYYQRCPEALEAFETHARGHRAQLEGEMVERALYCLMYWFETPGEIEMSLAGSIPHHHDTLSVAPRWYSELIDATADVVVHTIPAENTRELAVWAELRGDLAKVIEDSSAYVGSAAAAGGEHH